MRKNCDNQTREQAAAWPGTVLRAALPLLFLSLASLHGCDIDDGPLENAGEELDERYENSAEQLEETVEDLKSAREEFLDKSEAIIESNEAELKSKAEEIESALESDELISELGAKPSQEGGEK